MNITIESVQLLDIPYGGVKDGVWDVTIADGRIRTIRQAKSTTSSKNGESRFLLPGLIDTHVHLIWDGSADPVATLRDETHEQTLLRAVRHCREFLHAGITTVRDLGSVNDLAIDLAHAVEAGDVIGPTIIASGRTIVMTGGHDPFWGLFADGVDEVLKATRTQIYRGAGVIKVSATGGVYGRAIGESVDDEELGLDELEAIVREAHKRGLRVASHAIGLQGISNSIKAGVDTIEHGHFLTPELARELASRNGTLVPTLFVYEQIAHATNIPAYAQVKAQEIIARHKQAIAIAREAGLRIAAGSDAGSPLTPHTSLHDEMAAMVAAGLTPAESIRAATSDAAVALGLENQIGVVEEGLIADLILVNGNPIENLDVMRLPARIWHGGREIHPGQ